MNLKEKFYKFKNNIDIKEIIFFLIISIIFFGVLINMEYATDTYTVFTNGAKQDAIHFMGSGRLVSATATIIARVLNLGEYSIYIISYVIAIISLVLSLYEMKKIIQKDIKSDVISRIISILIILNVFIIELFLFIEKGILILSILMNVLAIKYMVRFLETKNKKEILKVLLLMFLANGCYQGTVGLFVALTLVYIIKYSKNIKEFLKNNVIVAICYAVPAILDLLIAKLFKGDRVSGNIVFTETIEKILSGTQNMMETYNIIPKYIFPIVTILIIAIIIYKVVKNKTTLKEKVIQLFSLLYIIIGTLVVTILPQMMQNTASIWMVARSTYTFASLIGILLLYLFNNFESEENSTKIISIKNVIITLSLVFLIIEYCSFVKIEISRYKLNHEDKEITLQIIDKINEYEKQTGNIVSKIALYQDKNIGYTYPDIFVTGDMNIKAYSVDWATLSILKYYWKTDIELVSSNEEIANKFKECDWSYFDEDQLIFDEDTLHICCY